MDIVNLIITIFLEIGMYIFRLFLLNCKIHYYSPGINLFPKIID